MMHGLRFEHEISETLGNRAINDRPYGIFGDGQKIVGEITDLPRLG